MKTFTFTLNIDGEFLIRTISESTKADCIKRITQALIESGIAKTKTEAKARIISCTQEK